MSRKESISRIKSKLIEQLRGEDKDEAIVALALVLAALISMTCQSAASAMAMANEMAEVVRKFVADLKPGETMQ